MLNPTGPAAATGTVTLVAGVGEAEERPQQATATSMKEDTNLNILLAELLRSEKALEKKPHCPPNAVFMPLEPDLRNYQSPPNH